MSERTITECKYCSSQNLQRQTGKDEPTKHYGRLTCGDCDKFLTWLRDPSVSMSHLARQNWIRGILKTTHPNQWERGFLQNICKIRVLTEKQQSKYEAVYQKYSSVVINTEDKENVPLQ